MSENKGFIVPKNINDYFKDDVERIITLYLLEYVFYDGDFSKRPEVSPKTWRDAENLVRLIYKRETVWHHEALYRAENHGYKAICKYAVNYIEDHLSKKEICEVLSDFFTKKGKIRLTEAFEKKLKINILKFLMDNKKYTVTKKDFEKNTGDFTYVDPFAHHYIFKYPRHLELSDEAFNEFSSSVYYGDTFKAEYYLGATDDLKGHDKWFYLAKHILITASEYNYETFSLASTILKIIRSTIDPKDKETISWMNNQIFEIFWSRVDGLWPITHRWWVKEDTILSDSVEWLLSLDDLKARLPGLPNEVELDAYDYDKSEFKRIMDYFRKLMREKNPQTSQIKMDLEYIIECESVVGIKEAKNFEKFINERVIPAVKNKALQKKAKNTVELILKRAKRAEAERKNIKNIAAHLKEWPDNVSAWNNPEFLTEIKLEYITKAICLRGDPWYEKVSSPWNMDLELNVNGKKCKACIDDQSLYRKYYDEMAKSNEFDLDSEIPMQYGRETFTRKK